MHPKGTEVETECGCQYYRKESREIRQSAQGYVLVYYRTCNTATLFKDSNDTLEWKILVERAENLNQPMGIDSSEGVKQSH